MSDHLLAFKNVGFQYDEQTGAVINDLSFSVAKGDRLALKAESGGGKTTVFRLILGFEQPDEGTIRYQGTPLDANVIHQLRKQTAWLPQDLNLGAGPVQELIQFPFTFNANTGSVPRQSTIARVFEQLGLAKSLLQKNVADLSTGQRQRAGIALCWLLNKPLMLLDEPTSALDTRSKERVANLLLGDSDRTIISTSHDPWWVDRCKRVVELH